MLLIAREFESVETSRGFAQLLEKNWVLSHKKQIIQAIFQFDKYKNVKIRKLGAEHCAFTKILQVRMQLGILTR